MNEHELLSAALKRTDPAERAAFLDETCAGDSELRRRLVDLLAGDAESGGTLDQSPVRAGQEVHGDRRPANPNRDRRAPA